jgi:subtilisin family serine protease
MLRKIIVSFTGATLAIGALGIAPAFGADPAGTAEYIVVFKDGTSVATQDGDIKRVGAKSKKKFRSLISGSTAQLNASQAKLLASDPDVAIVELDGIVTVSGAQTPTPSWGLDRVDQGALPLNNTFNFPDSAGAGVNIFVVDTGLAAVNDLGTRAIAGFSTIADAGGTVDCNGHGTHVAGTAAGTTYGVAKAATVIPVRVLNCTGSGSYSGVIAGLDWVRTNYVPGQKAVVNMSLGGGASRAIDAAVNALINAGVTVVVAAGNSALNACNASPARVPNAITVGATGKNDSIASYSNHGQCLDLFAPGSAIVSSNLTGGSVSFSGTSMASPHVAGAAAIILGASSATLTPSEVSIALSSTASTGKVKMPKALTRTTANKLLSIAQ